MWREGWRIEGVEGKGHYTAECGGRAADRARQERKVREVKRGEARRGEVKQHRCRNWYSSGRGGRTGFRAREGRGVCGAVGIMRKKSYYWAEGKSGTNKF